LTAVGGIRGWPATLTEPDLLDAPVALRPVRVADARAWREIRVRNAAWLRPWEPSNPETPLQRSSIGPYVSMVRTMRREAKHGQALPWVVSYGGRFAGQLTVGSIVWGSSRSGQIGYWIDESYAGRGIIPTALAMAVTRSPPRKCRPACCHAGGVRWPRPGLARSLLALLLPWARHLSLNPRAP